MKKIVFLFLLLPFAAQSQTITTIAGTGTLGDLGDGGPATAAVLYHPQGITRDNAGNIYFTNHNHADHRVRKIDAAGIYTTVAGIGTGGYSGDGGPATAAMLNDPLGMCTDKYG